MVAEFDGEILVEGYELFGEGYSDCVITASTELLNNEPEVVKGLIKVLMQAQQEIEQNQDEALAIAYQKWFKVSDISVAERAMEKVFPQIDQRSQVDFIMDGVDFMLDLGYIPEDLASEVDSPDKVFDWSYLEAVIEENPELYESLEHK
jgi:NitT/TauT family transport system substrate-binding protein